MGLDGYLAIPSRTPSPTGVLCISGILMIRLALDFLIYLSQHMVLAFLLMLVLWLILVPRIKWSSRLVSGWATLSKPLFCGISLVLLVLFASVGIWYLTLDSFAGEVEPLVSSLSWLVQSGQPLYHEMDAAERYSVLYGPSVFLTNGLFLKFLGPSMAVAKLGSLVAAWAGVVFLYASIARKRWDSLALIMSGLGVLYFWLQGFAIHLVRPDAFLLFAVGMGLFSAVKLRRVLAIIAMGAALGFAVNLKVHAFLYFLPLLALLAKKHGRRPLLAALVLGVVVALSPFLLYSQVSLRNYISWLRNATGHGLEWETLVTTFRFGFFLMIPVLFLGTADGSLKALKRWRVFLLTLLFSLFGVLILSAKPGAGLVHLLPMIPIFVFATAMMIKERAGNPGWGSFRLWFGGRVWAQGAVTIAFVVICLSGTVAQYRAVAYVNYLNSDSTKVHGDVQNIMDRYPNMSMAMACGGEDTSFQHTWVSPLLVFADNPLMFEPVAVMDCQLAGQGLSPKTFQAMADGQVALWLVPKQEKPFTKNNWYAPYAPIFSKSFVRHFMENYTCKEHTEFFDLWFWNGIELGGMGIEPSG